MVGVGVRGFVVVLLAMFGVGASGAVAAPHGIAPIPDAGPTVFAAFIGHAAAAQPLAKAAVAQNPSLAPNPFNNVHNDTWMSDTYAIAGPLGHNPVVWSSTLAAARRNSSSTVFVCGSITFDRHGRLLLSCSGPGEASIALVNPVTLTVISRFLLPVQVSESQALSSAYTFLDKHNRIYVAAGDNTIKIIAETGPAAHPRLKQVGQYDLSKYIGAGDNVGGLMPDWHGRIWFVIRGSATVGILDSAGHRRTPTIKTVALRTNEPNEATNEAIKNSFAVTRDSAYIVTTRALYRVARGRDGAPHIVWSAVYENIGTTKPGQYSPGSGTTPTILDGGRYVAIADNADQTHVDVYRTAKVPHTQQQPRVCEVPVFQPGAGAAEDSLIGYRRSLIIENNYGYTLTSTNPLVSTPSTSGFARIDIAPNGKSCRLVWINDTEAAPNVAPKLSTRTGLIYTITRRYDTQTQPQPPGLDVYYWTALDFRTGKMMWARRAGTGQLFDSWYPGLAIGPTGTAYVGDYGGLMAIRDTHRSQPH